MYDIESVVQTPAITLPDIRNIFSVLHIRRQ